MNTIFKNLLKAIGIMTYFIILNFAYTRMDLTRLINDIEIFAGIFLILGLVMLEKSYKNDSGKIALSGIELLVISMHSLSINHVITFYEYDFRFYLLTSSYFFSIYYVLKSIIIYTREKKKHLKELSDISEIVKEEPIKKEAKKRIKTKNKTNISENKIIVEKDEIQEEKKEKRKKEAVKNKNKNETVKEKTDNKTKTKKKVTKKKEQNSEKNNEHEEKVKKEKKTTRKTNKNKKEEKDSQENKEKKR